ncbi:ankyrin repeat domain-containing protein [Avibacterium avium]|uniref:ankyrin repeat domain-containing protein n=1 Tax=Avibacterium avium TaxID=751 RepID=UPI003BF809B1
MKKNEEIGIEILEALDEGNIQNIDGILLGSGRNLNEVTPKEKWNWLHKALLGLNPHKPPKESIKYLIKQGIPVNAQDIYGMTPLHYAMRAKNAEAAIALLEAGADPNIPNQDNLRPLSMIGYMPNRLDILEMMLDKGANVDNIINENETILESYDPKKYPFLDGKIYNIMKPYSKV